MAKRRPSGDGMVRRRKDGRWEGRIVIGHKEDGASIFRYVSARTQKELLRKLHLDMEVYLDADLSERSNMPLGEWLDHWLDEYAAPDKPFTSQPLPRRRPGTGCISQINDHLREGRYSPVWPDGKKRSRDVYASTREECEEKLKVLTLEMKAEIAHLRAGK